MCHLWNQEFYYELVEVFCILISIQNVKKNHAIGDSHNPKGIKKLLHDHHDIQILIKYNHRPKFKPSYKRSHPVLGNIPPTHKCSRTYYNRSHDEMKILIT